MQVTLAILAGGVGKRLWPLSTEDKPKQFLKMLSDKSLLEETILRFEKIKVNNIEIIAGKKHKKHLKNIKKISEREISIIYEPSQKNTCPSILLAALANPDSTLIISPSDHYISDITSFSSLIKKGLEIAKRNKIVSIGIKPSSPNEQYGYIQKGKKKGPFFEVLDFKEKPNKHNAKKYFRSKKYLWNSGIFICHSSLLISEISKHEPKIFDICSQAMTKNKSVITKLFNKCPPKSIDHALMEKTEAGVVIEGNLSWNDLGSWNSILEVSKKDTNRNVSNGSTHFINSKNNLVKLDGQNATIKDIDNIILVQQGKEIFLVKK